MLCAVLFDVHQCYLRNELELGIRYLLRKFLNPQDDCLFLSSLFVCVYGPFL